MSENERFRELPLAEVRRIVTRFEDRLNEEQGRAAPSRKLVHDAIHHNGAPRCPVRMKRLSTDIILRYGDALSDLFSEFPDDLVMTPAYDFSIGYQPKDRAPRIDPLEVMTKSGTWVDEWGVRWGHSADGVGATPVDCPLKDWGQLDDFLARMPDPAAPGRLDAAAPSFAAHGVSRYCGGFIHLALFERLHCLRGMENIFLDLSTNEKEVMRLRDAIVAFDLELIRGWARIGAQSLFLGDDWGTQASLMVSLDMWRAFFADSYRTIFGEVHRNGMDVLFHSCGNIMGIIPDLIELGVDVIDPMQPGAMDPREIARRFGGKVAFCGGIDDQRLSSQTPAQIKAEVARLIETLGTPFGNSLIVAPGNIMTPEIPLENLRAVFEACHGQ